MKPIFVLFALACLLSPLIADDTPDFIPLKKGTYWVYRGTVTRSGHTADGKFVFDTQTVTWRSEVVGGPYRLNTAAAWLLHGSPMDLVWSGNDVKPEGRLIFQVGTNFYDLVGIAGQKKDDAFDQLQADISAPSFNLDAHADEINRAEILCEFPLALGQRFADTSDKLVDRMRTGRYCWNVQSVAEFDPSKVKGFPHIPHPQVYGLLFQTNPDDCEMEIVPGVGIVGYHYHHHGTPMQVELELVEYHAEP